MKYGVDLIPVEAGNQPTGSSRVSVPDRYVFPVQTVQRRLQPWPHRDPATVLSRPEPILVIVRFGRRDAAFLDQLPVVLGSYGRDRRLSEAPGVRVTKLNDKHAFLQIPEELRVGLGEVWSFWNQPSLRRVRPAAAIPLVDHEHQITGAVTTDL